MLKRLSLLAGFIVLAGCAVLFLRPVPVAHAQGGSVATQYGTITVIANAWGPLNIAYVTHSAPQVNPGNCTASGYMTNPTGTGIQLLQSIMLGAFLGGKQVQLVINGCVSASGQTFPQIIAAYAK